MSLDIVKKLAELKTGNKALIGFGLSLSISILCLRRVLKKTARDHGPKCVLVTGCANGLGRATVEALVKNGDFVIGSDIDKKQLEVLAQLYPTSFRALPFDVSVPEAVSSAAKELQKAFQTPCLDAIINNAGIYRGGPLTELSDKDMSSILNINVLGTFLVTKHFLPLLKKEKSGVYRPRIINLSSEVAYSGVSAIMAGPYSMSKYAIEAFCSSLRQELSILPEPVYVVTMTPGPHATDMTKNTGTHFGTAETKQKSRFYRVLVPGEAWAQKYMDELSAPASALANRMVDMVHLINPPTRQKANVSLAMEFGRFTPQFVMDFIVWASFRGLMRE